MTTRSWLRSPNEPEPCRRVSRIGRPPLPMRNKWASCSTAGTLSFNGELLEMERDLGDYVIVHELLHFSVPNHGKLWKSLMRAHLGDYEHLEARMKQATHNPAGSAPMPLT